MRAALEAMKVTLNPRTWNIPYKVRFIPLNSVPFTRERTTRGIFSSGMGDRFAFYSRFKGKKLGLIFGRLWGMFVKMRWGGTFLIQEYKFI